MKQIGLVGGLGWVSTAEYYGLLNVRARDELGDHRSARVLIDSLDEQEFLDAQAEDPSEARCEAMIIESVARLAEAGSEVIALCANGLHRFVPAIIQHTGVEVIDIAGATVDAVTASGLSSVGLLGVRKTMEGEFYRSRFEDKHIEVLTPDEATRSYVHDRIIDELTLGIFTQSTRESFLGVCQELVDRGAEGVVLGCTEIPLLLDVNDAAKFPLFSTTAIHCEAILKAALTS
ncbi:MULTISPECIES: aspartate/glutamate racemase family protein [Cryobacterium]|uniref:Amino acid racemase n=1 Tax=Cryobacterium glucosi TaxID=1259175 RepID=A0ABY2II74_9MICO|nr:MULTISPECIES: amino acid racemase [Cryobacterium]TFB98746.1 amino acid racemase [Cryobacterium sp. MDB2-A-1]TFC08769.1 amino acid racemase [Cryobacterium sp. MDB2-33-2]TFC12196.1 amino acid racemase [Cryobacterium sp. MDB2-A-2]TFC16892.1 amino acid racemase [Cryobacterium glucosi]TFC23049.1 amino acid racemase [Cryobacterium sp. MDB2-10]